MLATFDTSKCQVIYIYICIIVSYILLLLYLYTITCSELYITTTVIRGFLVMLVSHKYFFLLHTTLLTFYINLALIKQMLPILNILITENSLRMFKNI